jgi:hypothetical protein
MTVSFTDSLMLCILYIISPATATIILGAPSIPLGDLEILFESNLVCAVERGGASEILL